MKEIISLREGRIEDEIDMRKKEKTSLKKKKRKC